MADGTHQTPTPSDVAARAQAVAPAASGDVGRICLPCRGQIAVAACYTDGWRTPLTDACVRITDRTGVVVDGAMRTEPLAAHGLRDGDAPTAPLVTLGTTPPVEVARGGTEVSLIARASGDTAAGMDTLGAALTGFRDMALGQLRPFVLAWEQSGVMSVADATSRGFAAGLSGWFKGESDFWGSVSALAVEQYQAAQAWIESRSDLDKILMSTGAGGWLVVVGKDIASRVAQAVSDFFSGAESLVDYANVIMQAVRDLASGTVDVMQRAFDALRELPGDIGALFAQLIDNGQDWIERLNLIASETNAFEYVFHTLMAVVMSMTPNFWAEMFATVGGFILPEVIIELIFAAIAALTGGAATPALVARWTVFVAKLRRMGKGVRSLGVLADVMEAFKTAIQALARIGRGLHDEIEAVVKAGSDGIARVRYQLNQYKLEIDPSTLGMNGGNIRIVRKRVRPRMLDGNSREGWEHIQRRHMPPDGEADLFPTGTTRAQVEAAADDVVTTGVRTTLPDARIQVYEKRMTVNGLRTNYRVVVDSQDGNRIITMFPILGGG